MMDEPLTLQQVWDQVRQLSGRLSDMVDEGGAGRALRDADRQMAVMSNAMRLAVIEAEEAA